MIISIEGNIGSGKSTFFNTLKKYFSKNYNCNGKRIHFIEEPVDIWENIKDSNGNSILKCFYENKEKYSFPFQILAYISRLSKMLDIINSRKYDIIITERCVFSDRNVFAKMLHNTGNMNEHEWKIYDMWFDAFIKQLPTITFVYLKTSPEVCLERINTRNREGENISIDYLKTCNDYHDSWLEMDNGHEEIISLNGSKDKFSHYEYIDIIKQYIMWENHPGEDPGWYPDYSSYRKNKRNEVYEECVKRAKTTHA